MLSKSLTRLPSDNKDERVVKVRKSVVGKSIEEIMIKRNLSSGLPLNYRILDEKTVIQKSINNRIVPEDINANPEKDTERDHVMNSLMDYCRSLQNRIDVKINIRRTNYIFIFYIKIGIGGFAYLSK